MILSKLASMRSGYREQLKYFFTPPWVTRHVHPNPFFAKGHLPVVATFAFGVIKNEKSPSVQVWGCKNGLKHRMMFSFGFIDRYVLSKLKRKHIGCRRSIENVFKSLQVKCHEHSDTFFKVAQSEYFITPSQKILCWTFCFISPKVSPYLILSSGSISYVFNVWKLCL